MFNKHNILVAGLLALMATISIFSITNMSLTMDELAHLPAGYSYLVKRDMRINPEHPPLIKDLAGLPLLFIKGIEFPSHIKSWQEDVNGQWDFGNYFLFKTGNPADKMIFWSRIPMIMVLVTGAYYTYRLAADFFGKKAGILSLFLYTLSPTLLAHGRLVTTDTGVAVGIVASTYYFLKLLKEPNTRNIILSGLSFGFTQLAKFTGVFLVPYFLFLLFVWALFKSDRPFFSSLKKNGVNFLLVFLIATSLVMVFYIFHTAGYPAERQARDTNFILTSFPAPILRKTLTSLARIPVLRGASYYLLGLFMVLQRGASGHTTYFLGEVSASGWKNYFPFVYMVKLPLSFHLLTLGTLLVGASRTEPFWKKPLKRAKNWIKNHFTEFSLLCFIGLYWAITLNGNLNLGVRHLLPTIPLVIILVSQAVAKWLHPPYINLRYGTLTLLLLWQAVSLISIYPHLLPYFNMLVGGPSKGHIYVVDSNLDWGQDLRRLKDWVEENNVEKIYVDYFGGADTRYYLKDRLEPWWGTRDPEEIKKPAYLAVSASHLQGGKGFPVPGFEGPTGYYRWLSLEEPVTRIGYSIFVYRIE